MNVNTRHMVHRPSFLRGLFCLCMAGAALLPCRAQQVTSQNQPQPAPAPDEEVVKMDPFEVSTSGDRGYISTSASTGTRIAEELKNIPQSIVVLNQELIEDLAPQSLDDILAYTAGIDLAGDENEDYEIRGHSSGQGMMDGFRQPRQFPEDTADIERVEIMMGPSSILFGASAGDNGIVNRIGKRPKFKPASSVQFRYVDTSETLRAVFDTTAPVGDSKKLAYRVVGVIQDDSRVNLKDFSYLKRYQVMPKILYKFSDDSQIFVHAEFTRTQSSIGQQLARNYDYILYQNPVTGVMSNSPTTAGSPNIPVLIDVPDAANPHANLVQGNLRAYRLRAIFTSQLSPNWALRVGGSSGRTNTKWNDPGVAGSLSSNGRTINRGRAFERDRDIWQSFLQAELAGKYTFDWGRVSMIAGPDVSYDQQANHRRRTTPGNVAAFDFFAPDYSVRLREMAEQDDTVNRLRTWAAFANANASLLNNRLRLDAGVRYTDWERSTRIAGSAAGRRLVRGDSGNQPAFGAIYFPIENVGLYASYSENIVIRSTTQPDGQVFPPRANEQQEIGVKSSWLDGRVVLTAAYFENSATNVPEDDPLNPGFKLFIGEQTVKGYEVSAQANLTETWQLIAGFTHKTKERTGSVDPGLIGQTINLPKEKFTLWTRYRVPSGPLQGLAIGAGTTYQTERVQAAASATVIKRAIPAYQTYDAMVSYRPRGAKYSFQINVRNLTDKKYWLRANANRWTAAAPRTTSVQGTYNF